MVKRACLLLTILSLAVCRMAGATGILLPSDKALPALGIKSHRVAATVKDGVSTTKVTEIFYNSTKQRLEATYVFPIPREAALTDFAMYINGKRQSGQVVEAAKARQVYEDIVRRMRDPGLLEYMDSNLLKMRVFPIEPDSQQTIEVAYSYALPYDNGIYRYTFPLKTGEKASSVLEDSTFSVDVTSKLPLTNVYSPSHKIGISRKGDREVLVGFEEEKALLNKDFVLYYSAGDKDFGLNLITYRPKGQDGYFALMLAPRVDLKEDEVMPKDVCFLLDVSGSMIEEDRIKSAKEAVKFCLKSLNAKDRFALVAFSTGMDPFAPGLTDATKENVEKAVAYVDKLEARGGTFMSGALAKGFEMAAQENRPYIVVLITDGKPTIGEVEPDKILDEVKKANKANVRVFTFGIAEELDVPLLDKIAEATKGYSEYVAPSREIETEISSFFRKVSYPVLSNLKLAFGKVQVRDMYPQQLPDLFRGSQVVAFGRYTGSSDVAVELTGLMKGKEQKFAFDATFPETVTDNTFVSHLWAQRKIAYLVDQIRLHGETKELKDEVVLLSKEYGIATPYTSYLVLEDEKAYVQHGIMSAPAVSSAMRGSTSWGMATPTTTAPLVPMAAEERFKAAGDLESAQKSLSNRREGAGGAPGDAKKDVEMSKALRGWKEAQTGEDRGLSRVESAVTPVDGKTFAKLRGVFVDTTYKEDMETLKVKWGSDAYFALIQAMPELRRYLALGENVIVVVGKRALVVSDEGKEQLTDPEIKEFTAK